MDFITVCVSLVIAILSVAYPILLQVITRLDDKYSSNIILELFNKEKITKWFKYLLIVSLFSILLVLLKLPVFISLPDIKYLKLLVGNSAIILLILITSILIYIFFVLVDKVIIYSTPTSFFNLLVKEHKKSGNRNDYILFKSISDLLYLAIKSENENQSLVITRYLTTVYRIEREQSDKPEKEFPSEYYFTLNRAIRELAINGSQRLNNTMFWTAGGYWLFDIHDKYSISEITYSWLWSNLSVMVKYKQDDFILEHWKHASGFIDNNFPYIQPNLDDETNIITNQQLIDKREAERSRFFEMHYVLGGLLLFERNYGCIERLFRFTMSEPADYPLLPNFFNNVFQFFYSVVDEFDVRNTPLDIKYNFPYTEGIGAERTIELWLVRFCALLFIRQFTTPYVYSRQASAYPDLPKNEEIDKWLRYLNYFQNQVNWVRENSDLLQITRLNRITDENLVGNSFPTLSEYFINLRQMLESRLAIYRQNLNNDEV